MPVPYVHQACVLLMFLKYAVYDGNWLKKMPDGERKITFNGFVKYFKGAFTRAILRVGGLLHLTADTQKAVGWRVS